MTIASGSTILASDLRAEHNADGTHGGSSTNLTLPSGTGTPVTTQAQPYYRTDTKKLTIGDGTTAADVVEQGFDAQGACTFGDGGTTNYVTFAASTGDFTATGTGRWTQSIWVPVGEMLDGGTPGIETEKGALVGQALTISDSHIANVFLPPDLDASADITIKVKWSINEAFATNSGEVQFRVDWTANPMDATEDISSPSHTGQADSGDINIPAVADRGTTDTIGTIGNASLSAGDLLGLELSRIAIVDGSNPTAEPVVYGIVLEYTGYRFGS